MQEVKTPKYNNLVDRSNKWTSVLRDMARLKKVDSTARGRRHERKALLWCSSADRRYITTVLIVRNQINVWLLPLVAITFLGVLLLTVVWLAYIVIEKFAKLLKLHDR